MAGLFDPPSIGGGGAAPAAAASPGMMPGAVPQAGFGAGGGMFNDAQNTLLGANGSGWNAAGITDAVNSIAGSIGANFAKDPRKRALYAQAQQAYAQHKQSNADEDYRTLLGVVPQYEALLKQVAGNPQAVGALMPTIQHLAQNIDVAAQRAGKSPGLGQTLMGYLQTVASMPAEAQAAESGVGKIKSDLARGVITQAEADAAIAKETNLPGQGAGSPVGKIMEDLKAGRIDQKTAEAIIRKETYVAPPAQGPDQWSAPYAGPNGIQLQRSSTGQIREVPNGPQPSNAAVLVPIYKQIQEKGIASLSQNQKDLLATVQQQNPLNAWLAKNLPDTGGAAPGATTPEAAPATVTTPAPATPVQPSPSPQSNLGTSKDVPVPVDNGNAETVVRGVIASGTPVWAKGPDGRVEQITPAQAAAWLKLHGLPGR